MSANSEHDTASNIDIRNSTEKTRRYVYDVYDVLQYHEKNCIRNTTTKS